MSTTMQDTSRDLMHNRLFIGNDVAIYVIILPDQTYGLFVGKDGVPPMSVTTQTPDLSDTGMRINCTKGSLFIPTDRVRQAMWYDSSEPFRPVALTEPRRETYNVVFDLNKARINLL